MTHCLVDPAAVTHRKQFSGVHNILAKQKLVLMNTADSTEQTVQLSEADGQLEGMWIQTGVFHLKVWGHYFI